jgi:hypothetical protein
VTPRLLPLCGPSVSQRNAGLVAAFAVLLACSVALAGESVALVIARHAGERRVPHLAFQAVLLYPPSAEFQATIPRPVHRRPSSFAGEGVK